MYEVLIVIEDLCALCGWSQEDTAAFMADFKRTKIKAKHFEPFDLEDAMLRIANKQNRSYPLILSADWMKDDLAYYLGQLKTLLQHNFNVTGDIPLGDFFADTPIVTDGIFSHIDTVLREQGLQLSFIERKGKTLGDYIMICHKVEDFASILQLLQRIDWQIVSVPDDMEMTKEGRPRLTFSKVPRKLALQHPTLFMAYVKEWRAKKRRMAYELLFPMLASVVLYSLLFYYPDFLISHSQSWSC